MLRCCVVALLRLPQTSAASKLNAYQNKTDGLTLIKPPFSSTKRNDVGGWGL